ncbi:MAG: SPFH domain-containing protein [Bacteroidota bacterium]
MSLWKKLTGEFVDIIEWLDDSNQIMVYRFDHHDNEIKYGAKLIVREGQAAAFVNMGELADVFQPGTFTLETPNIPILSKLQNWKHGFESPFKAEVYFVNTRQFTDQKWGTKNPVMLRDPEFGPVRLRSFGTYALRITDPAKFLRQLVGTNGYFTMDDLSGQLRNMVVSRYTDLLGESNIPVLDLAANYDELGNFVRKKLAPEFDEYGLTLTSMLIENISLPPEVEKALDKRTSMGVIGDLTKYTQFQAAEAMEKAAENPGGTASGGIGMGMGFAIANQMGQAMSGNTAPGSTQTPPPIPNAAVFHVALDGKQAGPFDTAKLSELAAAGSLTAGTLVWKPGMANWAKAADVPEVSALLSTQPPPLPPQ